MAERAWLIRHGQSESNAGLPSSVPSDTPLTCLGRGQAEQVAAAFTGPPALIVTSPFVRARQTAVPTADRFPGVGREEWPVQEFTYLGDLHGQTTTGRQREPYAQAYWQRADPFYVNGGAESFADLLGRTRDCLARLKAQEGDLVAVFSHGIFIRALMWSLLTGTTTPTGEAMRGFQMFAGALVVPNCSIVELAFPGPTILAGTTAHLTTPAPASRDHDLPAQAPG